MQLSSHHHLVLSRKHIDAGDNVDDGAKLKICGNFTLLSVVEVLAEARHLADLTGMVCGYARGPSSLLIGVTKYGEFLDTFFAGSPAVYYGKRMEIGGYGTWSAYHQPQLL